MNGIKKDLFVISKNFFFFSSRVKGFGKYINVSVMLTILDIYKLFK